MSKRLCHVLVRGWSLSRQRLASHILTTTTATKLDELRPISHLASTVMGSDATEAALGLLGLTGSIQFSAAPSTTTTISTPSPYTAVVLRNFFKKKIEEMGEFLELTISQPINLQ